MQMEFEGGWNQIQPPQVQKQSQTEHFEESGCTKDTAIRIERGLIL
jgi:hypothetical protein